MTPARRGHQLGGSSGHHGCCSSGTPARTAPTLLTTPSPHRSSPATPPSFTSHKLGAGRVRAVLLGAAGAGKTSLVRRFLGQEEETPLAMSPAAATSSRVLGAPPPTVGVDFASRSVCLDGGAAVRLHLWDTSGQERFKELADVHLKELEDHDAVIVLYAVSDATSLEDAVEYVRRARRLAKGSPRLALVGTKADAELREVSLEEGRARAEALGAAVFVEVSCPPCASEPSVGSSASAGTEGPIATCQAVEAQLLRPLLRGCLDSAPLSSSAVTPPASSRNLSRSTPSKSRQAASRTPTLPSGRVSSPPPKQPNAAGFGCASLCRCLRLAA